MEADHRLPRLLCQQDRSGLGHEAWTPRPVDGNHNITALAQVAEPTLVAEGDLIGANRTVQGEIRIANTGSPGPVGVETVRITIFWQPGGGSWTSADPQAVYSTLAPGEVINKDQERTFTYSASFTAPAEATEFRSVVEVTVAGRADTFSDTRHFRPCELLDDLEKELDG